MIPAYFGSFQIAFGELQEPERSLPALQSVTKLNVKDGEKVCHYGR